MDELGNPPGKKLLTRPGVKPTEVQSLDALLTALNDPTINNPMFDPETGKMVQSEPAQAAQAIPPGQLDVPAISVPIRNPIQSSAVDIGLGAAPVPQTPMPLATDNSKLYFTGRMLSGKDSTAHAAGCKIFGFASPLYSIATYFFGREVSAGAGKDLPGCRAFLQAVGQYGRGALNEAYPMTPARATFVELVRNLGTYENFGKHNVNWSDYGRNDAIWLDAALKSVEEYLVENPAARVGITNCRFENERAALKAAGWQGWHCLTSSAAWNARLLAAKLTAQSPQVLDLSERLAASLDGGVIKEISARKTGPMLRVVWCDTTPPPSPRIHTVASFLRLLNVVAPAAQTITNDDF